MISKKAFPTYAQYYEDVILLALFSDVEQGTYIDVGANYSTIDSVTKLFYDKGWRGINIEPLPSLYKQLVADRPGDTNLHIGMGSKEGELDFFENIDIPGHSSFRKERAADQNDNIKHYKVPIMTLGQVVQRNNLKKIHFLKIDVEGFEDEVIKGIDWKGPRPEIICIEANHRENAWQMVLIENGYRLFINDGLNEYYIAKEVWSRTINFADKVVKLSYNSLRQHQFEAWTEDTNQIKQLTKLNETHFKLLQGLRTENIRLEKSNRLSLSGRSFWERVKRSVYGLTIDWLRWRGSKRRSSK